MARRILTLDTLIGPVIIRATGDAKQGAAPVDLRLELFDVKPHIPIAMSVRRLRAVTLDVRCETGLEEVVFEARFPANLESGPENGEHLDAESVVRGRHIAMVGTDDGESLRNRMPWIETGGDDDVWSLVDHQRDGLVISLGRVPEETNVGLHFLVAENDWPEPEECACWHAVDRRQYELAKLRPSPLA